MRRPTYRGKNVHHVNGGHRCGCGNRSAVWIVSESGMDYFLCADCATGAAITWCTAHSQDRFTPADEATTESAA